MDRLNSEVLEKAVATLALTSRPLLAHRRDLLRPPGARDDRPRPLAVGQSGSGPHMPDPSQVPQAPLEHVRRTGRRQRDTRGSPLVDELEQRMDERRRVENDSVGQA
jgi:hypothetical protein